MPPEKDREVSLAARAGEKAPAPHPLYVTPGVLATFKPPSNVSAKFTPVNVSLVGLVKVNDMTEVLPGAMVFGEKVFWIVTLEGPTMDAKRALAEKSEL